MFELSSTPETREATESLTELERKQENMCLRVIKLPKVLILYMYNTRVLGQLAEDFSTAGVIDRCHSWLRLV